MDFTASVFDPETGVVSAFAVEFFHPNCISILLVFFLQGQHYEGREALAHDFDIIESEESHKAPLLAEVLKRAASGPSTVRMSSAEVYHTLSS